MKTLLSDYWLIWLSAVRCPKVVYLPGITWVGFITLWLIPVSMLIFVISIAFPPIKVIFLVAWGLATIVAMYYWVSFLVGASELNRPTYANLVPVFRRRIIQLIRGTWLMLTINTSFLIWIGYVFLQKDFYVTVYCWLFLCVGTVLSQLGVSTLLAGKPANFIKSLKKTLLYFIAIPLVFLMAITAGMGELLLLVLMNEVILVICSAFLIWRSFNKFATMFTIRAYETNLLIQLHQRGQEALATAPAMVPSVADTKKINTNDYAYNQRLESSSAFGGKYILKPLTALLLCLDQPRETPRNALLLNLLGLRKQPTSIVAESVYFLCENFLIRKLILGLVIIGIVFGIIYLIVMALPYLITEASSGFLIFAPLGLIPIFNLRRYANRIALTNKEQALVRLSPMLHSLSDMNQMLAQIMLWHSFFIWLKWTGITLIATALLGTPATSLMMQLALCCMSLPFLGTILIDYAADGEKQFTAVTAVMNLCLVVQLVWFMTLFAEAGGNTPYIMLWLMGFILSNITLALAIISIRWSKMMASPIAFPAGRMQA